MSEVVSPAELKRIAQEIELKKACEAHEKEQAREAEKQKLQDAFFQREVHPEAKARVSAAVRRAAEAGQREILVGTFAASEPDWFYSLDGFAKRAFGFYVKELQPLGYKVRAEILNYPGGMSGNVGLYLSW